MKVTKKEETKKEETTQIEDTIIDIDVSKFDVKFEPIKLSGVNLAQNYVSGFNTGMNIYQCLNYLQGYISWTIKAVNDVVKLWNKKVVDVLNLCIEITKKLTKEEFDKHWSELKPQVIELVHTETTNQFNEEWTKLKPQVIELVNTTTETKFNEKWTELKPQLIQLTKDTTIEQFNQSWTNLQPELTNYVKNTINNYVDDNTSKIGKINDSLILILNNLKSSGAWSQTGATIFDGSFNSGRSIATGNINLFGGTTDGNYFIRTNNSSTENDLAGGV